MTKWILVGRIVGIYVVWGETGIWLSSIATHSEKIGKVKLFDSKEECIAFKNNLIDNSGIKNSVNASLTESVPKHASWYYRRIIERSLR